MMAGFDSTHIEAALARPSRYPHASAGLAAALASLGTTPGEVADTLLAGGFRGARGCDGSCPVAEFMWAMFPRAHSVCVTTDDARLYFDGRIVAVDMPAAIATLVKRFDDGGVPELEAVHDEERAA